MQPVYITLPSSVVASSPWRTVNWYPTSVQQFGWAVLSSGGSSGTVDITLEDGANYPNPNSSTPTAFPIGVWGAAASGNTLIGGIPSSLGPMAFAAFRLTINSATALSSGLVTLVTLQSGIG